MPRVRYPSIHAARLPALLGAIFCTPVAHALEIEPSVGASFIYTDNLRLEPDELKEDDFVLVLRPALALDHESRRVNLELDYGLEMNFYENASDANGIFQIGRGALDLVLLENHLFLDTLATISQTPIDPTDPIARTNVPVIVNRTDRALIQTNPRWQSLLFGQELNLNYTVGRLNYDDPALQDATFQTIDSSYGSPQKAYGFGWQIEHRYARYEYKLPPAAQYQILPLNLDFALRNGYSLLGMVGLESDFLNYSSATLEDTIWYVGVSHVSDKSELSFTTGERSFGRTYNLRFRSNLTKNGFALVTYDEIPANSESLFRTRNAPTDPDAPLDPDDIDQPGTGDLYIRKRYGMSFSQEFGDHGILLSGFYDQNTDYVTQDGSPPPEDRAQIGGTIGWGWEFGVRTRLDAQITWIRRGEPAPDGSDGPTYDEVDKTLFGWIGVNRELGQYTDLSLWLGHNQRDNNLDNTNNYSENQIGITVDRRF